MQLTQICLAAAKGLALTTVLTLVACIDLKQSIEISDGFASYQMEMRMNAALAQLDAENLGKFCESNDDLRLEVSGRLKRTIKQSYEGEDIVCRMRIVGPIQEFGEQMTEMPKGDLTRMLNFQMVDETTLRIESTFEPSDDMTTSSAEEKAMISAMMQGRVLTWSVKAPRIIESSGEISADSTQVDWSVPMAMAMQWPHTFTATVKVALPWYQPVLDLFS
ncbi:MAG: hypothetical protein CMD66_04200 [Gammaproteobacteria bacterium]|nr:hypothetical protein [Gammaproteobacteria bacterium]|tara:strand:+ start:3302 stop:3961 length:660 start_codon:yes stop_codon:yes gene_type:complete